MLSGGENHARPGGGAFKKVAESADLHKLRPGRKGSAVRRQSAQERSRQRAKMLHSNYGRMMFSTSEGIAG